MQLARQFPFPSTTSERRTVDVTFNKLNTPLIPPGGIQKIKLQDSAVPASLAPARRCGIGLGLCHVLRLAFKSAAKVSKQRRKVEERTWTHPTQTVAYVLVVTTVALVSVTCCANDIMVSVEAALTSHTVWAGRVLVKHSQRLVYTLVLVQTVCHLHCPGDTLMV